MRGASLRRLSDILRCEAAGGPRSEELIKWAGVKLPNRAIEKTVRPALDPNSFPAVNDSNGMFRRRAVPTQ